MLFLTTGTEEAFCALFASVHGRVRRYFRLRGLDAMTAEDLAQNVLFTVSQRTVEIRDHDRFHGWLFAIARNELLSYWRRQKARIQTVEFEPISRDLANTLQLEQIELQGERFLDWISTLEPSERDLIVLRFVEELSYEDLAVAFNIPLSTVKWRLFQIKKKLTKIIGAEFPNRIFIN